MSTVLFLVVGFLSLILAFVFEGGELGGLIVGTAGMIVFGGTLGAVGVSFPFATVKRFPTIFRVAFRNPASRALETILFLVDIAGTARRQGVLALESMTTGKESFSHLSSLGLRLVVDGVEPKIVREVMESYLENTSERHRVGFAMFEAAGGFAPTMGIIGTVMGLVHVLGNLSDPGKLGPAIAVAFIATLYGVASANLLWLPLAAKLKALNEQEVYEGSMMMEGITLIGEGVSPRIVEEKLQTFLDPQVLANFTSPFAGRHEEAA